MNDIEGNGEEFARRILLRNKKYDVEKSEMLKVMVKSFARRILLRTHKTRDVEGNSGEFCAEGFAPYP